MDEKSLPSPDALRQMFSYDEKTGDVVWLKPTGRRVKAGDVAGARRGGCEYLRVGIHGKYHQLHRVIWAMKTGEWPESSVDHIDGDGANNRWENLRAATLGENQQNRMIQRNNISGATGVSWDGDRKLWRACIQVNRLMVRLGRFQTVEAATSAYAAAKLRYHGFNQNPVTRVLAQN